MSLFEMIVLGVVAGGAAGLLAGLVGIGGGVVIVPTLYYGLTATGLTANDATHVAVATSLASIVPSSLVSFVRHLRAGHADLRFLTEWGPGIIIGVAAAQIAAPYIDGRVLVAIFALLCLFFSYRFAFPARFSTARDISMGWSFRCWASVSIGVSSGLAGVGGGILTNIVMTLSGFSMHKSIGRAAAAGVAVSIPAMIVATLFVPSSGATRIGSVDLAILVCIAPAQAVAAWLGASIAVHTSGDILSRVFAIVLAVTGVVMMRAALWP